MQHQTSHIKTNKPKRSLHQIIHYALALCTMIFLAASATAQTDFPAGKPIRMMVPYPAGGPSDMLARIFNELIGKEIGQQVIVENLGGATGTIGARKVLTSPADGYYIFQGSQNETVLAPLVNKAVPYASSDFKMLQPTNDTVLVLLVRKGLQVNTLDEFIDLAKNKKSEPLTYGSVGVGSGFHLITEHLANKIGTQFLHVPYQGSAPVIQDLAGGQIDFAVLPYQNSMSGLEHDGRLKVLSSLSNLRPKNVPALPLIADSKKLTDFEFTGWSAYFVRAGTPDEIVTKLREAIARALKDPKLKDMLEADGRIVHQGMSQEKADQFYTQQSNLYKELVQTQGFKPF